MKQNGNQVTDVLFQIAASPINYGFYQSPYHIPYDHYERSRNGPPLEVARSSDSHFNNPHKDVSDIKVERVAEVLINKAVKNEPNARKVNVKAVKTEARQYPVYTALNLPPPSEFTVEDAVPSVDLTSRPGEVQADFALDLPYNGLHFQSPTPIVSA